MAFKKRILAATAAIAMLASGTGVAYAANTYVSGELNTAGTLVQYDYTRMHTFNGPITLSVDNMPSGYLRLGLRNMNQSGGPQFTETLHWNTGGTKSWNDILKGTRFAFQGRMQECRWVCDYVWGGSLTY